MTEQISYQLGGQNVPISDQLASVIQGYIALAEIGNAIPQSITIESLPACGILTRVGNYMNEYQIAIFWSYTREE